MQNKHSQNSRPGEKRPGNPLKGRIFFWLILILGIPLFFQMLIGKNKERPQDLMASQFETLLDQDCIITAKLQSIGGEAHEITGEFYPNPESKEKNLKAGYRTKVLYTTALDESMRQHCKIRTVTVASRIWGALFSMFFPVLLFFLFFWLFIGRGMGGGNAAFQFGKNKARLILPDDEKVTLKDVAGCDEAKEEVREIVDYLKDPKKFSRLGGRTPRGILMVGQPGTGKTLMARAIAGEANVPFFSISGSDFVEMFVGVGASRVREMFADAKRMAPCLIFIDEIDAVGRSRFSGIGGGHDEREQTLNAMLVEMDGFEENAGVIVLAATNRPDVLDPALLRPGRFDRQVVIDLPDINGRYQILQVHAKKIKLAKEVDLHQIARGTPGFAGADLANLLNEAAILATRKNQEAVTMAELEEARDKVCWGKERRSRKLTLKERKLTAYHEAGHTLMAVYLKHTEPLHKVTIIPRGMAMGATMYLPDHDRYNVSYLQCIDTMAMAMGGRIAEKLIFEDVTSGASMDLRQATETARRMVCEWGMIPEIGPVSFTHRQANPFTHEPNVGAMECGAETEREIDLAIRKLTSQALQTAENILTEHLDQLKLLAETLLERESMNAGEVYELLGLPVPVPPEEDTLPMTAETAEPENAVPEKNDQAEPGSASADSQELTQETPLSDQPADRPQPDKDGN